MNIAIQDANIIFDLLACDIFDAFFDLPIEIHTTSLVIAEIRRQAQFDACQEAITNKKLLVQTISTEQYLALQARRQSGLSEADLSVMELAEGKQAILLTGDGALRKSAIKRDISVRGIIWIFDQMVDACICDKPFAASKLEILKAANPRLPVGELDKRIDAWSK